MTPMDATRHETVTLPVAPTQKILAPWDGYRDGSYSAEECYAMMLRAAESGRASDDEVTSVFRGDLTG